MDLGDYLDEIQDAWGNSNVIDVASDLLDDIDGDETTLNRKVEKNHLK